MRMDTMPDCKQDQKQTSKRNYKYTSTTDQAVIKQTAHLTRAKTTSTRHIYIHLTKAKTTSTKQFKANNG